MGRSHSAQLAALLVTVSVSCIQAMRGAGDMVEFTGAWAATGKMPWCRNWGNEHELVYNRPILFTVREDSGGAFVVIDFGGGHAETVTNFEPHKSNRLTFEGDDGCGFFTQVDRFDTEVVNGTQREWVKYLFNVNIKACQVATLDCNQGDGSFFVERDQPKYTKITGEKAESGTLAFMSLFDTIQLNTVVAYPVFLIAALIIQYKFNRLSEDLDTPDPAAAAKNTCIVASFLRVVLTLFRDQYLWQQKLTLPMELENQAHPGLCDAFVPLYYGVADPLFYCSLMAVVDAFSVQFAVDKLGISSNQAVSKNQHWWNKIAVSASLVQFLVLSVPLMAGSGRDGIFSTVISHELCLAPIIPMVLSIVNTTVFLFFLSRSVRRMFYHAEDNIPLRKALVKLLTIFFAFFIFDAIVRILSEPASVLEDQWRFSVLHQIEFFNSFGFMQFVIWFFILRISIHTLHGTQVKAAFDDMSFSVIHEHDHDVGSVSAGMTRDSIVHVEQAEECEAQFMGMHDHSGFSHDDSLMGMTMQGDFHESLCNMSMEEKDDDLDYQTNDDDDDDILEYADVESLEPEDPIRAVQRRMQMFVARRRRHLNDTDDTMGDDDMTDEDSRSDIDMTSTDIDVTTATDVSTDDDDMITLDSLQGLDSDSVCLQFSEQE